MIPGFLLRHSVTVEPYLGDSAHGPTFGAARTVRCFVEDAVRTVLNPDGEQVVSTATFYCQPDETIPARSKVTIGVRATRVIDTKNRDSGGLVKIDHLEVICQ
jgi:hypothetical protein